MHVVLWIYPSCFVCQSCGCCEAEQVVLFFLWSCVVALLALVALLRVVFPPSFHIFVLLFVSAVWYHTTGERKQGVGVER